MGAWGSVTVEDGRTWSSQSVDGSGNPAPLSGGVTQCADRALFGLCLYTGCRINEACTRLTRDVYRESGTVRAEVLIRKQDTKGQQATRSIQVHPQLRRWLEDYYPKVGKEYLFPGRWGRQYLKPTSAHKLLQSAFERVGIVGASTPVSGVRR